MLCLRVPTRIHLVMGEKLRMLSFQGEVSDPMQVCDYVVESGPLCRLLFNGIVPHSVCVVTRLFQSEEGVRGLCAMCGVCGLCG